MNFEPTEERRMMQDALRRFLSNSVTPARREAAESSTAGFDRETWAGLAELGVIGALFPEARGGYGGSGFDIAAVFEEMGRAGAIEPLLDTGVLAGGLLMELGGDARQGLVEQVIGGELQLALAHAEPASRYDLSRVTTRAERSGDTYVLNGRKSVVVNAPAADLLLVSARMAGGANDADGICLFLVDPAASGLALRDYPLSGGGRGAELDLRNVAVAADALIGAEGAAYPALVHAHARATTAICAEAVGLMDRIRVLTTDYLKTRKQFGQPIGKFQALQHRMADMLTEIEQARSALINLAGHLDGPETERDVHVAATKNLISRVCALVVEESIQMHGGIGMTMEYELGHLAKRLTMTDHRFGDGLYHLERFISLAVA
ncbi:acyl-CoA dehydrogenase family protein [Nitratireductor sp. ZSWI3]|uniref:acyl-CoA dehydrogenase family protein n=1 Tax=Nitratireductor sp. ZSWI3 TaxID=2966359 RepID=UPI00214FB6FB|nr:acyl-CoA dehydrogenase [Nitratireductor sp. ZSWI3]MCR4267560.1 acyl-CoA dehydrogenase [Nitratireductor sp. ZSWI3]